VRPRRLEHEPAMVVHMLMDDKPGPVTLTVSRGTEVREVVVARRTLACLQEAGGRVDTRPWSKQLASMRELANVVAEQLEKLEGLEPAERQPALDAADAAVVMIASLLPQLAENVRTELYTATRDACGIAFE
jgi:hypothetical protein